MSGWGDIFHTCDDRFVWLEGCAASTALRVNANVQRINLIVAGHFTTEAPATSQRTDGSGRLLRVTQGGKRRHNRAREMSDT